MPATPTPDLTIPATTRPPNGRPADADVAAQTATSSLAGRVLARATSLTSVASIAAAGMIVIGAVALIGGNYDRQVVHDQLAPQKIFFPAKGSPALLPGVSQYAGQQVLNGAQAKAYANEFIGVHLSKIAGGKTYSEVSAASMADPKNATLIGQKASLFQGETLRGLLLNAWGWSLVGTIATLAGWLLIAFGALLLALPLLNWNINLRGRHTAPAA
jgi:hypothetical protein